MLKVIQIRKKSASPMMLAMTILGMLAMAQDTEHDYDESGHGSDYKTNDGDDQGGDEGGNCDGGEEANGGDAACGGDDEAGETDA